MSWRWIAWWILLACCCSGCVGLRPQASIYNGRQEASVVFFPTHCSNLLSCINESQDLSRKEFSSYYKKSVAQQGKQPAEEDQLRLICLSMHQYASYKQFKQGLELLEKYIDGHPDEEGSLQGLNLLLKRINREKIKRWSQQNRLTDEKEVVEEENRGLLETVAGLEGQRELDQKRINELQKQIEQLKNIENIIKNREL